MTEQSALERNILLDCSSHSRKRTSPTFYQCFAHICPVLAQFPGGDPSTCPIFICSWILVSADALPSLSDEDPALSFCTSDLLQNVFGERGISKTIT